MIVVLEKGKNGNIVVDAIKKFGFNLPKHMGK
jgi:hypothetical protein